MHPLWEILDDICTMKCIEVIAESQERKGAPYTATTSTTNFSKYTKWLTDRGEMPTAEELVKLSAAISHLKRAMRSWVKFVPPILFQNIVAAGIEASLGVARMDVTVLFCDIADFREMIVDAKPNVVLDLIGKVLSRITNTVEDYEGQMLEFIGDEILAVFNCPATVLNHARKAVCSALVSQELMNEIDDFDVRLHIGINRARVLAGNLGSFTRMKYGVLGDGVNMAARIKSLNTRFSTCILASPTVLDFENAHEEFVTRPIGNLILKGRTVPTLTYEVLGQRRKTSDEIIEAAELHSEAFDLYRQRCFVEAKMLFNKVNDLLLPNTPQGSEGDRPSLHYARLCEDNLVRPPGDAWDGSERLTKKAW
jgi:class 3 adenylate cyclase